MGELAHERYGNLLFQVAQEEAIHFEIYRQLEYIGELYRQEEEYIHLLKSSYFSKQERREMVDKVFAQNCHPYIVNFLKILVDKERIGAFPEIFEMYKKKHCEHENIKEFFVTTAVEMTEEQKQRLTKKLEEANPNKKIELKNLVDNSILGGIKIKTDDKELDRSFESMLKDMKKDLQETII